MGLKDYIKQEHGTQRAFAACIGVDPQQVTKWINMECIVVGGVLYSPRRLLKGEA